MIVELVAPLPTPELLVSELSNSILYLFSWKIRAQKISKLAIGELENSVDAQVIHLYF